MARKKGDTSPMEAVIAQADAEATEAPESIPSEGYGEGTDVGAEEAVQQHLNPQFNLEEPPEEKSKPEEEEEPLYSEDEVRAIETGWTPKEAYKGDPNTWRDAKSWNDRNRTQSTLEEQRRRLDNMEKNQNEMLQILREERGRSAQLQINSLEKEKENAILEADVNKVKMIEQSIAKLRDSAPASFGAPPNPPLTQDAMSTVPAPASEVPKEVLDFVARNRWFNEKDEESMRKTSYAKALSDQLIRNKPEMPLAEQLAYIEKEVNRVFMSTAKPNIAPVENRRSSMNTLKSPNGLPEYDQLPRETRRLIEGYALNAEFRARKGKKSFDKGAYRTKYVKQLLQNGIIDNKGTIIGGVRQ
jgi:hypothetical protein